MLTRPAKGDSLPYSAKSLEHFEAEYCDDRFWGRSGDLFSGDTRLICTGQFLAVVGRQDDYFFTGRETGMYGQFRHQYFLLFLIAHFHRAALLSMSDELAVAMNRLEVGDLDSVRQFKRAIRSSMEIFLRFTHRYWFHQVSNQNIARSIFDRLRQQLGTETLYEEVGAEVEDMYVQAERLRAERDRTRAQFARAEAERGRAERVSAFLVELFRRSDPWESGGENDTALELLERGAKRIETELANDPDMMRAGSFLSLTGGLLLTTLALFGVWHPAALFLPAMLVCFANAISAPNATSSAIGVRPDIAGAASGLTGFVQLIVSATAVQLVAAISNPSPYPLVFTVLGCNLLALLVFVLVQRRTEQPRKAPIVVEFSEDSQTAGNAGQLRTRPPADREARQSQLF